jgi:protein-S-isoprenylcysteine O-methyltransferase Ste14
MQSTRDRLRQSFFMWAGAVLLFFHGRSLGPLFQPLFPAAHWVEWTGGALAAAGLALTWWARIHLGRQWSAAVTLKENHVLVRSGPYAITRHPIYTGLLLALAATALVVRTGPALLGLALLVAGLVLKLRQEERFLSSHFGEAYRDYQARVPALVPGIW